MKYPSKTNNMKNSFKKLMGLSLLAMALVTIPANVLITSVDSQTETVTTSKDDLIGGWEYSVEGAPEGYDSGLLMIVKADGQYKVQVQTATATMNGTDIVVKKNTISFNLMVEGESVSVKLTAKGSQLTGSSTSSSGVYSIMGTKSISPQ